jgi:hypothetical protein
MGIVVTCSSCRYTSKVPDEHAGKEVICPQCGNTLKVPEPGSEAAQPPSQPTEQPTAQPAPPSVPPTSVTCPSCQKNVSSAAKMCIWCGSPLAGAPPAQPSGGPAAPDDTRKCPYCAETIKAAARKCHYCGEILDPQLAKTRRQQAQAVKGAAQAKNLDKMARDAFIISLIGLLCFCGIITGPIAIIQGVNVNKQLKKAGRSQNGLATAAIIIGIVSIVVLIVGLVVQYAASMAGMTEVNS